MAETAQNILVIENDTRTLDLVSDVLEKIGFSVFTATSADVGHSMARKLNPSLIFLNLATPGTGGLEICKKMQKDEALSHIPIVLLTLRDGKFDPAYTKFYGIVDFLKKPFDSERLIDAIKVHLPLEDVVRGDSEITAGELAMELGPYGEEEEEAPAWDAPPGEFIVVGHQELEADTEPAEESEEDITEGISVESLDEGDITEGISTESAEGEDITEGISILRTEDEVQEGEEEEAQEETDNIDFELRIYDKESSDESLGSLGIEEPIEPDVPEEAVETEGKEAHTGQEEDAEAEEEFSEELANPEEKREFEEVLREEVEEAPSGRAGAGEDIDEVRSKEEKRQKRSHRKMLVASAAFVLAVAVGFASLSYFTTEWDKYAASQTAVKAPLPSETDEEAAPSFDIKVGPEEKSLTVPAEPESPAEPAEETVQESPPATSEAEIVTPESLRPEAPAKEQPKPKQPPVAGPKAKRSEPIYYVQFGLFKSQNNAESLARKLSAKGIDTFIEKGTLKSGETSYRVLLNEKFSSSNLARSRGTQMKGAGGFDYALYSEGR